MEIKRALLAGAVTVSSLVGIGASQAAGASESAGSMALGAAALTGVAPSNLGGGTVAYNVTAIPMGVHLKQGTVPSPSLGSWDVPAGAKFDLSLHSSSPTLARWIKDNSGDLNVFIAAVGTEKADYADAQYHATARGLLPQVGAPITVKVDLGTPQTLIRPAATKPGGGPYPVYCTMTETKTYYPTARIGREYTWLDESGRFTYGKTASTSGDMNTQGGPANLGFTIGNSMKNAASKSMGDLFSSYLLSDFTAGTFLRTGKAGTDEYCDNPVHENYPYVWDGGMTVGATLPTGLYGSCPTTLNGTNSDYGKDTYFNSESGSAGTITAGVSFDGITIGVTSGWSQYVVDRINFGTATYNHWICGHNAPPTHTAIVYSGPNS